MLIELARLSDEGAHDASDPPLEKPEAIASCGGSRDVEICGRPALRGQDSLACNKDPREGQIVGGNPTVTINGKLAAGRTHKLQCGAVLVTSQTTVVMNAEVETAVPCACSPPTQNAWTAESIAAVAKMADELCPILEDAKTDEELIAAMASIGGIIDEYNRSGEVNAETKLRRVIFDKVTNEFWDLRTEWGVQRAVDNQIAIHNAYEQVKKKDENGELLSPSELVLLATGAQWYVNIGPGNIQLLTAYEMFQRYPDQFPDIPKTGDRGEILVSLGDKLDTYAGSAAVANVYMKHAQSEFAAAGVDLSKYSGRDRAGILMTYFKQGPDFLKRYTSKALAALGEEPPRIHQISAGEGCSLCLHWDEVIEALCKCKCTAAMRASKL